MARRYDAVLFDLLTGLLDSWSLWDRVAGAQDAGRRWRAAYLELTYGCGAYRRYGDLVADAAERCGMPRSLGVILEAGWNGLQPWDDVQALLRQLGGTHLLGVVTNCSERLGCAAAGVPGVRFDVTVTAERAGFYKPDPRPYRLALEELQVPAARVLYVAGSGFDLFGTAAVGLDTYWHNRAGLPAPEGAPPPRVESRSLAGVVPLAAATA